MSVLYGKHAQFFGMCDRRLLVVATAEINAMHMNMRIRILSSPWGFYPACDHAYELHLLKGYSKEEVYSVAFSSDDKRIASGGEDGCVRIWNL